MDYDEEKMHWRWKRIQYRYLKKILDGAWEDFLRSDRSKREMKWSSQDETRF